VKAGRLRVGHRGIMPAAAAASMSMLPSLNQSGGLADRLTRAGASPDGGSLGSLAVGSPVNASLFS
jgi:hypothetical protein